MDVLVGYLLTPNLDATFTGSGGRLHVPDRGFGLATTCVTYKKLSRGDPATILAVISRAQYIHAQNGQHRRYHSPVEDRQEGHRYILLSGFEKRTPAPRKRLRIRVPPQDSQPAR